MLALAPPVADYRQTLLDRLIGSGLLPADHGMELPDLAEELIPETFDLIPPTPDVPLLRLPPLLVAPVPLLEQVDRTRRRNTLFRWLPATGHKTMYWVTGTVMTLGRSYLPSDQQLKGCHIGYGEAACVIAQFPELGCCRTRQAGYPVLQAYRSRRLKRIVLNDATCGGNDMFRFVTFLRHGARVGVSSSVLSVRVS